MDVLSAAAVVLCLVPEEDESPEPESPDLELHPVAPKIIVADKTAATIDFNNFLFAIILYLPFMFSPL